MAGHAPRQRHIPELLEIHADELAYLWGQRRAALHDSRYTITSFVALNERIDAHVAGLLAVPAALPALLTRRLAEAADRDDAFAAAHGLLRLADPAPGAAVAARLASAQGPVLEGLRDALAFSPLGGHEPALRALLAQGDGPHAVAAATVLAQHERLPPQDAVLARLLIDGDAAVAAQAWRILTRLDARLVQAVGGAPPRPYKPALQRPEPALRNAVWGAAVWTAQPWARRGLRQQLEQGDAAALGWLAAVGDAADLAPFEAAVARLPALERPPLLARWGHPQLLARLVDAMRSPDFALAAAAAEAFTRVTGHDVNGARVAAPVPDHADDFSRDMAPLIWLPDLVKVDTWLQQNGPRLTSSERWNRGLPLGASCTLADLAEVDLPARWDSCARAALAGRPIAPPPPAL